MTYAGSWTVQLKSAVSQSAFSSIAIWPTFTSRSYPSRIVAAKLDLEAIQAVAANPVAEQDRVAVVGLGPVSSEVSIGSLPPTKCQAGMVSRPRPHQEFFGITIAERDLAFLGGLR